MFLKKFKNSSGIKTSKLTYLEYNSILSGYFCIGFIDFMFAGRKLTLLVCFLLMILKKITV